MHRTSYASCSHFNRTPICGSDLHMYTGDLNNGMEKGEIMGHEAIGFVEQVGNQVQKIKKGDRVRIIRFPSQDFISTLILCHTSLPFMYPQKPSELYLLFVDLYSKFKTLCKVLNSQLFRSSFSPSFPAGNASTARNKSTLCATTPTSKEMEPQYGHRLSGIFGYFKLTGGCPGNQAELSDGGSNSHILTHGLSHCLLPSD
jgi:hypothetical protein